MKITTRLIQAQDIENISKIHVDTWNETYRGILPDEVLDKRSYGWSKKKWQNALADSSSQAFTIIAKVESEIVGFAIASPNPRDDIGIESELIGMNILKKHHKIGVGKKLFQEVVSKFIYLKKTTATHHRQVQIIYPSYHLPSLRNHKATRSNPSSINTRGS